MSVALARLFLRFLSEWSQHFIYSDTDSNFMRLRGTPRHASNINAGWQ
jgi:hypothetical protein